MSYGQNATSCDPLKPVRRRITLCFKVDVNDVRNIGKKLSDDLLVGILWAEIKDQHDQVIKQLVLSKMSSTRFSQPWINTIVKRLDRGKKRAYQKPKL